MKSRILFIAAVCFILSGVVMARGFLGVSPSPNQMITLDDPNDPIDPNEPIDPNDPIDIPE